MMDLQNIQELVDKFWKGETTKEEEWMLREAVRFGKPLPELKELAAYFQYVDKEGEKVVLGEKFDQELFEKIRPTRRVISMRWVNMAAAVVVLLGIGLGTNQVMMQKDAATIAEVDTYKDPEEALKEVQKALMLLSGNMNEGFQHTSLIGKFHKAKLEIETNQKDDKKYESN